MVRRYYWLKLKEDFFNTKEIKKLRRVAGGDTFTIIYLKLQLLSLKNDGKIYFDGIEDDFISELSLEIDEDENNIKFVLMFLEKCRFIEYREDEISMLETIENIGKESDSAHRVRKHRQQKTLLSNTSVTTCNTEKEIEIEKEIEKDIDIYIQVKEYWNQIGLNKIQIISGKRKSQLDARVKEHGIDRVIDSMNLVKESDFLMGRNKEGWKCTFDWFIAPSNFIKLIEGNYKNREGVSNGQYNQANSKYAGIDFRKNEKPTTDEELAAAEQWLRENEM